MLSGVLHSPRAIQTPPDPNGDVDVDGFTNVEEILHQMAAQVEGK